MALCSGRVVVPFSPFRTALYQSFWGFPPRFRRALSIFSVTGVFTSGRRASARFYQLKAGAETLESPGVPPAHLYRQVDHELLREA